MLGLVGLSITALAAGDPLSHAYQRHFDAALSRYVDVGVEVEPKPYPTTLVERVQRFTVAELRLREAIADLTVTPPKDAKVDNAAMLAEYRMFALLYKHLIADLDAGNSAAAEQASSAVAHSPRTATDGRAVNDLKAKGYKFRYVARGSS